MALGKWRPTKKIRERRAQLHRCGSVCFLDPNPRKPRYIVCPPSSCRPTCEGLLAARRRAILQRDRTTEEKAIRRAKLMGCPWATGAAKARKRARARRVA